MSSAPRSLPRLRALPAALVRAHRSHHHRAVVLPTTLLRQPLSTPPPAPTKPLACSRPYSSSSTTTTTTTTTTTDTAAATAAAQTPTIQLPGSMSRRDQKAQREFLDRGNKLITTTPWRCTSILGNKRQGQAIERVYVFASTAQAAAFSGRIAKLTRERQHDPEWAGCGRHVYVRWTTHTPPELGERDFSSAEACDRVSEEVVGDGAAAGAGAGDEGGEKQQQQQHPLREMLGEREDAVRELWLPEYKRRSMVRNGRTKRQCALEEMEKLWEWTSAKVFVEGGGGEAGQPLPAWSMIFGAACVTQARFVENEGGKLVMAARELWSDVEHEAMKKITEETFPLNQKEERSASGMILEDLLKKVMFV